MCIKMSKCDCRGRRVIECECGEILLTDPKHPFKNIRWILKHRKCKKSKTQDIYCINKELEHDSLCNGHRYRNTIH